MAQTAAKVLIDALHDWGVEVVFGLPGDGINGIMEALRERQKEIRFIQVRHEEAAAFMACAYAKYTGKLGVCLGTSGPGGLHLLNGLYDAKMDGPPVLAITGHHFHDLIDTFAQQDVDLDRVFADLALQHTSDGTQACRKCGRPGLPDGAQPSRSHPHQLSRGFTGRAGQTRSGLETQRTRAHVRRLCAPGGAALGRGCGASGRCPQCRPDDRDLGWARCARCD